MLARCVRTCGFPFVWQGKWAEGCRRRLPFSLSWQALSWQTAALLQGCGGLREDDLLLLPSMVRWRELLLLLLSTTLLMSSPQTAGARRYKSLPSWNADAVYNAGQSFLDFSSVYTLDGMLIVVCACSPNGDALAWCFSFVIQLR